MADGTTLRVLGMSGSLRKASWNSAALRAAQELAPEGVTVDIFDLSEIPIYNDDVRVRTSRYRVHPLFNFIGDMRDHLNRPAEVLATSLFANNGGIHLACCDIVRLVGRFVGKAFIVT